MWKDVATSILQVSNIRHTQPYPSESGQHLSHVDRLGVWMFRLPALPPAQPRPSIRITRSSFVSSTSADAVQHDLELTTSFSDIVDLDI